MNGLPFALTVAALLLIAWLYEAAVKVVDSGE